MDRSRSLSLLGGIPLGDLAGHGVLFEQRRRRSLYVRAVVGWGRLELEDDPSVERHEDVRRTGVLIGRARQHQRRGRTELVGVGMSLVQQTFKWHMG